MHTPTAQRRLRCIFAAATALAFGLGATTSFAFVLPTRPYSGDFRALLHDLRAIAPGSTVTDAEKQRLAADLTALEDELVPPSSASVRQFADDLAAAVASAQFTRQQQAHLARDLDAVLNCPELDPARLRALLADGSKILAAAGVSAGEVQQLGADFAAIVASLQTASVTTDETITLREEGIPPGLLMNYFGTASLRSGTTVPAVVRVATSGLPPVNPYTVAVTKISDGSRLVLGTLIVHFGVGILPGSNGPGPDPLPGAEFLSYGSAVFGGPGGQPLPAGFDPTDVNLLTVTDSAGTQRFKGSFVANPGAHSESRLVNLHVEAGAIDPQAAGTIAFRTATSPGEPPREAFLLYLSGLPPSAPVTLVADGTAVGQFTPSSQGELVIAKGQVSLPVGASGGGELPVNALPAAVDLATLSSLALTDAAGDVLVSGGL